MKTFYLAVLLFILGCNSKSVQETEKERAEFEAHRKARIFKVCDVSEEDAARYKEEIIKWINKNYDYPSIDAMVCSYSRAEWPYGSSRTFVEVAFRFKQGTRIIIDFKCTDMLEFSINAGNYPKDTDWHKVEFEFGGPTKIVDGVPNWDRHALMKERVLE